MKIQRTRTSLLTLLALPVLMTQATRADYQSTVLADGPKAYYRLNDDTSRTLINKNSGTLGAAGNATNDLATLTGGSLHSIPGAIVGDGDRAAFFDFTTRTEIPFNAALNPPNTQPFSLEAWIYAASDQAGNGMGVLVNRIKPSDSSFRQGWVMYQRGLDANHSPNQGTGWDFQMYDDLSTGTRLQVKSTVPITLGKWQHVVVVYDPVLVSNATLTIYIDGLQANQSTWNGGAGGVTQGYGPATGDHSETASPHGQPAMALGGYNNANPEEPYGFANPWMGGIDEFAWYSNKLSAAQVSAHYQNGTNAARSTPYDTLIKSHNPVAYLRLDEIADGPDLAYNVGDLRSRANGLTTGAIKHPGVSALKGRTEDGSHSGHYRGAGTSGHAYTSIPFNAGNNPSAGLPFTLEAWFRPTGDQMNPGPSPINNRLAGTTVNRTGWVIYQRDPNSSYKGPPAVSGESGVGWAFRVYSGNTGSSSDVRTDQPYTMGEWLHYVVTWEPQSSVGISASGSETWNGILTAYVNGVPANTNLSANYAANIDPTEDGRTPTDLAIGSYNLASTLGEEFEGDVDEFAFYNNYVLTPAQILAHYQTGTNPAPATNYETLVFNAAGDSLFASTGLPIPEGTTIPKTYLRFNEAASFPAANSGSLGYLANASQVLTTNVIAGPTGGGFGAGNTAVPLDGTTTWVSLNGPAGLNLSGQITLEAWINPADPQGATARIISDGPPTPTAYDLATFPILLSGYQTSSNEVFLRIEGSGATYSVGTSDGTTFKGATAAVTAGDLGGANGWIHLVGTYDGASWNLYRNGVKIASAAGTGPLPVTGAEWAIGATGMGWADFFSGGIDEPAIYNTALTPARVANHYVMAKVGTTALTIVPAAGGNVTITWPAGTTLVQSSTINGTYTPVGGSPVSPLTIPAGGTKFYGWKLP